MLNNKMNILNAETLKGRIAVYLCLFKNKLHDINMPMNRQELAEF